MSRQEPAENPASLQPANLDLQITLTDNTVPQQQPDDERTSTDETTPNDPTISRTATSRTATSQRYGATRLREELARRKYAKYQEERYRESDEDHDAAAASKPASRTQTAASIGTDPAAKGKDEAAAHRPGLTNRATTFRRGRDAVKGLLGRKKARRARDGDAEIDILYENQRGTFLFGIPFYSSNSLLNFDPPAWTTSEGKPSPVNITNAQLPDPNWEWAWPTWYVDMSLDVDEEGWQYSFMFQARFAWHGTHPWFHSFVRRRRWVRKRVRKHRHLPDGRVEGGRTMHDAHKLNADYFTIHPARNRSPDSSYTASLDGSASARQSKDLDDVDEQNDEDLEDIRALLKRVKKADVDREKIRAVLRFMDQGGQDTYYLADEIPHIMSLFLFEHSRRLLATAMLRKIEESASDESGDASAEREPQKDKLARAKSTKKDSKRQNLVRAVKAADEQVKNLEFWSDIRHVVEQGDSLTGADVDEGWDDSWKGLGGGGPASYTIDEDTIDQEPVSPVKRVDKGKGRA